MKKFTLNLSCGKILNEAQKKILTSEVHKPFKEILLELAEAKISENLNLIVHKGNKTDEERGKYMGVVMVYEDLLNWFRKQDEKEKPGYVDIVKDLFN